MDVRQILYFKTVADHGSLARASERLHISQPAISAQISQLEAELNTRLLERHARGVRLTTAGSVLLEHARDILARLEQARHAVAEASSEVAGSVSIGMITTIANIVTPRLIERARLLYPKLELKIFEALSGEISAWHADGRLDLSVLYMAEPPTMPGSAPFIEESLFLLGPIDASGELGRPISFKDLCGKPLYHTSRLHACRLLLDRTARREKVELDIRAEIDSITLLYECVLKQGVFTIFPCSTEPPQFQRAVDYRPITEPDLVLRSYIVPGPGRSMSTPISAAQNLLRAAAKDVSQQAVSDLIVGAGAAPTNPLRVAADC